MRFFTALTVFVAALALAPSAHAAWVWPVRGELISTYRNGDDPYAGGQHRGIDIAAPLGARVVAATGGEVRFAGVAGSSGLTVSVRTADGFDTSYLHLSSLAVRRGDGVDSGDVLGAVGTSGRRSAVQPHLHFGVREAGTRHAYRNPLDFLPGVPAPPPAEAPDPAPVPLPAPAPPVPAPAPAAGRAPTSEPAPREAPRRVPLGGRAPRRVPAGGRAPRGVPAHGHAPAPGPAAAPSPAPRALLEPGRSPHPAPLERPAGSPEHAAEGAGPAPVPAARPALGPAGGAEPAHARAARGAAGRDRPEPKIDARRRTRHRLDPGLCRPPARGGASGLDRGRPQGRRHRTTRPRSPAAAAGRTELMTADPGVKVGA